MAPSTTAHLPPTITRSARWAPQSTTAASGSPCPEKRNSSSLNSAKSAALPTAISPSSGRPLQAERCANLLHQVGGIVRGRAIDAETDADAGLFHLADRTAARSEELVAA